MTHSPNRNFWPTLPEPSDLADLSRRLAMRDPLLARAVQIAARAHAGQLRDGTDVPYLFHPLSVAAIAIQLGLRDPEGLATAILHDVLEDSGYTQEDLAKEVGSRVAEHVALLTKSGAPGDPYFERLHAAPGPVRTIKGIDRFHNLLTIPEDRRKKYLAETRAQILPLLGDSAEELRVHRLLTQLAVLREAGDRKLTLVRDSVEGQRVEQALARRMRLDFEQLYELADRREFKTRTDKEGHLIFMVAYVVSAEGQVALFERSRLRTPGSLPGRGLLAAVTPLPGWPMEVSAFRRLMCPPDAIGEIRPLGQGVSDVGTTRYVFELFNVALRRPTPIALLSATDRFWGFTTPEAAAKELGPGRTLDLDLLRYLGGSRGPFSCFTHSALGTRIRERLFLGIDIVAFSTLNTYAQVAELLRLHQHLRHAVSRLPWRESLVFSPTGDGCFVSANPADLGSMLTLAGRLRHRIEQTNEETGRQLRLRFGMNRGLAFSIRDINSAENLIGDGINMAARMLGGIEPWELNVPPATLDPVGDATEIPEPYRFAPAQLEIKHHSEAVEVLRTITPALPGAPELPPAQWRRVIPSSPGVAAESTGNATSRDGGRECHCILLEDWPSYEDYETTDLGNDPGGGRHAEVSMDRCRACGRVWLTYLLEDASETGSGQWYRCLLTETETARVSARNALGLLESAAWHQYGGSFFGQCGTMDGPVHLAGFHRASSDWLAVTAAPETSPRAGSSPPIERTSARQPPLAERMAAADEARMEARDEGSPPGESAHGGVDQRATPASSTAPALPRRMWRTPDGDLLVEDADETDAIIGGDAIYDPGGHPLTTYHRYYLLGSDGEVRSDFSGGTYSVEDELWHICHTVFGASLMQCSGVYDTFNDTEKHLHEEKLPDLVREAPSNEVRRSARAAIARFRARAAADREKDEQWREGLLESFRKALREQSGADSVHLLLELGDNEPYPYFVRLSDGAEIWRTEEWFYHGADLLYLLTNAARLELGDRLGSFEASAALYLSRCWDDR